MVDSSRGAGRSVVLLVVALLVAVFGAGCRKADAPEPPRGATANAVPASGPVAASGAESSPLPRSPAFIRTINLTLAVASVAGASARIRDEVARTDGYVANLSAYGEGQEQRVSLTLRVPVAQLRAFRDTLGKLGETTSEDEHVDDVGEERADRQARLANARAEEKRLLDLLAQRTGSLADVLSAERELARVRETIERFEAQAAQLEGKIALATVNVSLVPSASTTAAGSGDRIAKAARDGIRLGGVVLVGIAVALAEAGPTLLIMALMLGLMILGARAIIRRQRRSLVRVDQG